MGGGGGGGGGGESGSVCYDWRRGVIGCGRRDGGLLDWPLDWSRRGVSHCGLETIARINPASLILLHPKPNRCWPFWSSAKHGV